MTSTGSTSKAFVQLTSPEEGNWLSLGRALSTVLCEGLHPFIKRETETFYNNVKATITAPVGPCTCVYVPGRRPNQYHDMHTCQWANVLQAYHLNRRPNWEQSDNNKWMDPNVGPWEIAKLFLPNRSLIKDVRDTRNTKWAHLPKLELSEAEKKDAFETLEKLLQDPVLARDVDAQGALREILALKCTSDVHIFKAEVLSHFKEAIQMR
ncbi:hypothetical protein OS493_019810 [Desmophyllum pertusum]|uniref:Uncharacterized protein n=1 Tax=Desmophyllum pertusum TaxID=174260 RepID=A0A9W9YZA1_9CNID|nr:hypothetical protein OS493_019810 [Desmophyllum pertusum]